MSNNKRPKIVASAEVGNHQVVSEKHTILVSFHDFESLPHEVGDCTDSPEMLCHGHPWKIRLYPGGNTTTENCNELNVSVYLRHGGDTDVKAFFSIRIGAMLNKETQLRTPHKFPGASKEHCWGFPNFIRRRDVLDPTNGYLDNGTLTLAMDIQVYTDAPPIYTPRKRLCRDMLDSLESENEGDVCFSVGGKRFMVIKWWINRRAPVLGEIADSEPSGRDIPIHDVGPAIFEALLRFVYTDEPPKVMADPQVVLKVANRFGCSGLKLIAEAEIVKTGIDAKNAVELLMFADGHSCALLREAALEFCLAHPVAIQDSEGWDQLKESPTLLAELLVGASPTKFTETNYDTMRVATLREKLDEKDLEVDGTRETLIRRLKEAKEK